MIGGVVLAAGAGERFGGRKQLAQLDGRPLLEHVLIAMADAPLERVVVVLGAFASEIAGSVPLHGATPIVCDDWNDGMGASLRAGFDALGADCDAIVVALGDQPRLSPRAVARVVAQRGADALAIRATYGAVPGHPVLFERELLARVGTGGGAPRDLLHGVPIREVACDGLGSPDDVDTPAALAGLREVMAR